MTGNPTPRQRRRAWLDGLTRDEDVYILRIDIDGTIHILGGMERAHRFCSRTATAIHLIGSYSKWASLAGKIRNSAGREWIVSRRTALRVVELRRDLAAVRRALKETEAFVEWTTANGWANATPRSALTAAQGTAERIVADLAKAAREAGISIPKRMDGI